MALKNRGKIQPAMEAAGYSRQTAKNPQNLTNSKSWAELLTEELPNDLLIRITREGLCAVKHDEKCGDLPDHVIRHRYLETALKMKGKLTTKIDIEQSQGNRVVGIDFVLPVGATISDEMVVKMKNETDSTE